MGAAFASGPFTGLANWQFLLLLFAINCLGELGVPFPLVLAGVMVFVGYLLAQGALADGASMVAAGVLGSISGALALYALARWSGILSRVRLPSWLPLGRLWRAGAGQQTRPLTLVGIAHARLVPGLALPVSMMAGATRVPWARLAGGVVVSEVLWVAPLVAIGYAMGLTALELDGLAERVPFVVALAAGVLLAVRVARHLWRRRRRAPAPV